MSDANKRLENGDPTLFYNIKTPDKDDMSCQSIEELKILKRDWYKHFLSVLEKLSDNIDSISDEFYDYKEKVHNEISTAKDLFRSEMETARQRGNLDLEKLEARFDKSISSLYKTLEGINSTKDIESLKLEIINVKHELCTKIDETVLSIHKEHEDDLTPVKTDMTVIKTRVSTWLIIVGLGLTAITTTIGWIAKDYIFKFFGLE